VLEVALRALLVVGTVAELVMPVPILKTNLKVVVVLRTYVFHLLHWTTALLLPVVVAAEQGVQGSLITKQQEVKVVALPAKQVLGLHLLEQVVEVELRFQVEMAAPRGVVANPELLVQLATEVMAVFIPLLPAAAAAAAILAAAAEVQTTAVLEPMVAAAAALDQVFTQPAALAPKVFRLVTVR
jgi:hypothetical protein